MKRNALGYKECSTRHKVLWFSPSKKQSDSSASAVDFIIIKPVCCTCPFHNLPSLNASQLEKWSSWSCVYADEVMQSDPGTGMKLNLHFCLHLLTETRFNFQSNFHASTDCLRITRKISPLCKFWSICFIWCKFKFTEQHSYDLRWTETGILSSISSKDIIKVICSQVNRIIKTRPDNWTHYSELCHYLCILYESALMCIPNSNWIQIFNQLRSSPDR